jgi:hypothetical protein
VQAVQVAPLVNGGPDGARSFTIPCDTVLLSVGLIPENELSRAAGIPLNEATAGPWVDADLMTRSEGIFACGNVLHVHDLVDYVSEEARRCGESAAGWLAGGRARGQSARTPGIPVTAGANVRYVVPNTCAPGRENVLFLRPLVVKNDARLEVRIGGELVRTRRLPHVQPSEMIRIGLDPGPVPPAEAVMEVAIR